MSAFLGPIHYQMFEKIKTVTGRSVAIFSAFHEKYGDEVEQVCGLHKGDVDSWIDETPLERLIGDSPIHGWLSEKVTGAESREGRVVKALLEKYGDAGRDFILEVVFWHGKAKGLEASEKNTPQSLEEMVGLLSSCMLDGMPCDSVVTNSPIEKGINSEHSRCLHAPNWDIAGVDKVVMCEIVRRWIDGFCESIDPGLIHEGRESVVKGDSKCVDLYKLKAEA